MSEPRAADQAPALTYVIYDVETTTKSPIGFPASPYCPDNEVVMHGFMTPGGGVSQERSPLPMMDTFERSGMIVGCNLKFDLAWAARCASTTPAKLVQGKRIWDVSHVEYILTRQRMRMPSLDGICGRRGIPVRKHGLVAEAIKNGMCPSTIAWADLAEYNRNDLEMTRLAFLAQFEEAKERGMLPLIWSQMKALVATAEMEYNGIHIDDSLLFSLGKDLQADVGSACVDFVVSLVKIESNRKKVKLKKRSYVEPLITEMMEGKDARDIMSSTKELSTLFFGGSRKEKERKLVGKYKNGKDKYKTEEVETEYDGIWDPKGYSVTVNGNGNYPVDDAVLKSLIEINKKAGSDPEYIDLLNAVRRFRDANKQLTTYVDGIHKSLWPGRYVHCSFNHSVTLTGRLSCSNPNLQNQTDGEIKKVYVPRKPTGVFIEYDYQQLEVIGLAVLSQDTQLIDDLKNGRDIHTELFKDMYLREPTKAERKTFKPLTFGLIYGAGANTLAENAGVEKATAVRFITTFYRRYPSVGEMHKRITENAIAGREMTMEKTEKGFPVGKYVHRLPTGREYEFREYDNEWKKAASFSPTELKNWPVQGFATGDIVPLVLGEIVEELTASEWYGRILPVVTVHDSIMFELHNRYEIEEARNYLDGLLSNTRERIIRRFGFDPGLDFHVEGKVGGNWKEME